MSTRSLDVGHVLGSSFKIAELLSTTDFAVSYRATREGSEEPLMLRTFDLAPHLPEASLPMIRKRFINEARQLEKLLHPGIEEVIAAGEEGTSVFLVTPFLESAERLDTTIARGPRRDEGVRILRLLLQALAEAHRQGHPHRDLTPARVRLLTDGSVKIADFGLVKLVHTLRATQEHASLLSPYSPPELVRGEEIAAPADLYAVGAIGWELLSGRVPFAGSGDALREAIVTQPPTDGAAAIPEQLRELLVKALDKDPGKRHTDANAMLAALDAANAMEKADLGTAGESLQMAPENSASIPAAVAAPTTAPPAPPPPQASAPVPSAPTASAPPPAPTPAPSPAPPPAQVAPAPAATATPAAGGAVARPAPLPTTPPPPRDVRRDEVGDAPPVLVVRKGPGVAVTFGVAALAAVIVAAIALPRLRPAPVPVKKGGPKAPDEGVEIPDLRPRTSPTAAGTRPSASASPATTPGSSPESPVEPGLVHTFETEEPVPVPVKNPLDGVDLTKLTAEEKEALVQQLADEVRRQVARRDAEAAREAKNNLDDAAPDDARFYEIEAEVLRLAIELPPLPKEGEEVSLMRVDAPPTLASHTAPPFPKRPPEEHREVVVKALVNERGDVLKVEVLQDDEYGSGAIAADAVRAWTFQPASTKGVKVKVWIAIPIRTGGEWEKPQFQVVGA